MQEQRVQGIIEAYSDTTRHKRVVYKRFIVFVQHFKHCNRRWWRDWKSGSSIGPRLPRSTSSMTLSTIRPYEMRRSARFQLYRYTTHIRTRGWQKQRERATTFLFHYSLLIFKSKIIRACMVYAIGSSASSCMLLDSEVLFTFWEGRSREVISHNLGDGVAYPGGLT